MKKIFSFMLMAVGLLISGNAKAAKVATMILNGGAPQDVENLTEAIYAVGESANQTAVITLTDNATLNRTPGFHRGKPGKDAEADRTWLNNGENITIDLAGHDITEASLRINIVNAKVQVINNGDKKSNIDASGYMQTFTLYGVSETDENVASDACYFKLGKNILLKGDAYMVCAMYYGSFAGTSIEGRPTYGMTIDIDGELKATAGSAMANNGTMSFKTGNKAKCPIINISGTAKVTGPNTLEEIMGANTSGASGEAKAVYNYYVAKGQSGNQLYKTTSAAVYGPGYSVWNVKGHLEGGVGIYIKSGVYNIDGADIIATADEYWEPIAYGNGFIGAGSAVIFDANKGYGGDITMTITGDTKVSSESGYAIQDINTNSSTTAVSALQIQSGSFESNAGGDVIVTTPDLQQQLKTGTDCKISGGTYGSNIVDYLSNVGGVVTPVLNENNEEVYVINVMPEEAQQEGWLTDINLASETSYVEYKDGATADITLTKAETKCAYLIITNAQKLIVAAGQTLSAGEIVLGENAAIEVAPTGKLIINGINGLVAFYENNLVIKADAENGMGTFVLNPAVKANKQPWATVEYMTGNSCGKVTFFGQTEYHWEVLSSPFAEISAITSDPAYFSRIVDGAFVNCTRNDIINDADAFNVFAICSNTEQNNPTKFTFTGKLQGANSLENYGVNKKFNYMGNAYMGKMNAKEMVQELQQTAGDVRSLVYLWNVQNMKWDSYTGYELDELPNVNPMAAIVLYSDKEGSINLDYEKLIWDTNK